jgi:hypothetical protein
MTTTMEAPRWVLSQMTTRIRDGPQPSRLYGAYPRRHLSSTAQNTWIFCGPAPVSWWSSNFQTETKRVYGQAHLREGRASKIGGKVELLIAR